MGTHSGTVDLGAHDLAPGEFYRVTVQGKNGFFQLLELGEIYNLTPSNIYQFNNLATPTAAEWGTLTGYARSLRIMLYAPARPTWPETPRGENPVDAVGRLHHRGQYLYYKIYVKQPHNEATAPPDPVAGAKWSEVGLAVDGVTLLRCRIDKNPAPARAFEPPVVRWVQNVHGSGEYTFEGVLDLATLRPGLAYGQTYQVRLDGSTSTYWDTEKGWATLALFELPATDPELPGWDAPRTWSHGEWVAGGSGLLSVDALRLALTAVGSRSEGYNPVVPEALAGGALRGVRQWRWLWYTHGEDAHPQLTWGDGQETGLPPAYADGVQSWRVYDLDEAQELYPGVHYRLEGVQCALESAYLLAAGLLKPHGPPPAPLELLANTSFEVDTAGWDITTHNRVTIERSQFWGAVDGSWALIGDFGDALPGGYAVIVSGPVAAGAGTRLRFSGWCKQTWTPGYTGHVVEVGLRWVDRFGATISEELIAAPATNGQWVAFEMAATAPPGTAVAKAVIRPYSSVGGIRAFSPAVDALSLRYVW